MLLKNILYSQNILTAQVLWTTGQFWPRAVCLQPLPNLSPSVYRTFAQSLALFSH